MPYRRREQPGCGGCLFILALFILLSGGFPALFQFMGIVLYSGLAGILLFVAIFWGFSYWVQKKVSTYEASQSESHNRFVWLLIQILMDIAKRDGKITKEAISTIQNFFQYNLHYSQTQMLWVKDLIKEAAESTQSLEALLQEFKTGFAYEPRLILLELIYQVLYTKQTVPEEELTIARNIASYLDISAYDQRTIEAKYMYRQQRQETSSRSSANHYYATLGLKPGADMDTIKKAYRKLSMKYHPDKVRHLGDEFKSIAEEKMKEINVAYDFFKKRK